MRLLLLTFFVFFTACSISFAQNNISGTIINENGTYIPSVSVQLESTSHKTKTDDKGFFSLKNIGAGSFTLHISHIGYQTFKKNIEISSQKESYIQIQLEALENNLEEITVSKKNHYSISKESPTQITVISQEKIINTLESNIIDVLVKNVPGLTAVKTGPNISKPFIRGLGYNRVLTLFDGLRQEGQQWGDEHGIEVDGYDIQKAEIIKGPASLMYGSDALAGVVSFQSFTPKNTDNKVHIKATSEFQSNAFLWGNGFNIHQNQGLIFWSVSTSAKMAQNYSNAVDQRVYASNFNEKNFSALFGLASKAGKTQVKFTWFDSKQAIPDGSRDSISRKFTKQILEAQEDITEDRPIVGNTELNTYRIPDLHQHIQHLRILSQNEYQIAKHQLHVTLGHQINRRQEFNHPTYPNLAGMHVLLSTWNFTSQLNFAPIRKIENSIGFNSMLQKNENQRATDFPIPNYQLFDAGVYFFSKWQSKKWVISGGIRQDIRKISWQDTYIGTNATTGFDQIVKIPDTAGANLTFPGYQKKFNGVSASLGFTYEIMRNLLLKGNYGRAYRAPNINEMASNGLDPGARIIYLGNKNFNPEFSIQKDLGVIFQNKNILIDISLFDNILQNYIYQSLVTDPESHLPLVDPQGNRTFQYQQAKARLTGWECMISIHPEKWKGFGIDSQHSMVFGNHLNFSGMGSNGSYLPLIPPLQWTGTISKKFKNIAKWLPQLTPSLGFEFNGNQNRYYGVNQTETFTPSYLLFECGVQAEARVNNHLKMQISLQSSNLFDTQYQSHLNRLKYFEFYAQSPNGRSGIYNMGRNTSLKVTIPF